MSIIYALLSSLVISLFFILINKVGKSVQSAVVSSVILSSMTVAVWIMAISEYGTPFYGVTGAWVLPAAVIGTATGLALVCICSAFKFTAPLSGESPLYLIPVFLLLAEVIFNKKHFNAYGIIYIFVIVLGIAVICIGKKAKSFKWLLLSLLSSLLFAFAFWYEAPKTDHGLSFISLSIIFALLASMIVMFILTIFGKSARIKASGILLSLAAGILPPLSYLLLDLSDGSKLSSVIIGLNVVITAVLSIILTKMKFSWKTACGILLLTAGTVIYIFCPI